MNNFSRNELCAAIVVKRGQQTQQQKTKENRTKTTTTTKHRAGMSKITVSPHIIYICIYIFLSSGKQKGRSLCEIVAVFKS